MDRRTEDEEARRAGAKNCSDCSDRPSGRALESSSSRRALEEWGRPVRTEIARVVRDRRHLARAFRRSSTSNGVQTRRGQSARVTPIYYNFAAAGRILTLRSHEEWGFDDRS